MLEQLAKELRQVLSGPLPGFEAQREMLPAIRNPERYKLKNASQARQGAVQIILYRENGRLFLPLIQRPTYNGAHSGQVAFPGGKVEEQDVDKVATALRESQEEVGVAPHQVEVLGQLSSLFIPASSFEVLPVVSVAREPLSFVPDSHEVAHIIHADVEELIKPTTRKETQLTVGPGISLMAPYFDVQDHVVWGATAMMLSEFVAVLKQTSQFP